MAGVIDAINGHSLDELLVSLREAIAFCSARETEGELRTAFRTPALNPGLSAEPRSDPVDWTIGRAPVERVIKARRHFLPPGVQTDRFGPGPVQGRLILFEAGVELFEGLGADETRGFVDEADTPSWDTWVAWVVEKRSAAESRGHLVAWIPSTLVDLVQAAADLCTTNALRWLDEEPGALREQLIANGTL